MTDIAVPLMLTQERCSGDTSYGPMGPGGQSDHAAARFPPASDVFTGRPKACSCCQTLVQEAVEPQVIDKGMPAPGLLARALVSRLVDRMPYCRQEQGKARSGVHTPRATLASWAGQT